ncbi:hypothetical protein MBCUT_01660 [Methanobrevibacter cuticularis]|uniref:Uncharacterized protein n=1 Tax=Methanobrevibacter cuticularis TaxID=47311 RepID=A0A166FHT5_9EURY|nr:hypothetical protein [Methanobrevibacter cuticularis]KZX17688.1 hypothetical protein MBCUT_01660 [Methanobrevibacter cuticularis]
MKNNLESRQKAGNSNLRIVTTPMCEKILEFAEIKNYKVNKNPDEEEGDLAILLSENKTNMDSLNIKLNTFSQIAESIKKVSKYRGNRTPFKCEIENILKSYGIASKWTDKKEKRVLMEKNSKIKVKVYSKFLKDIIEDMGFDIDNELYKYIVYPDYMKIANIEKDEHIAIEVPTHKNVSKDPIRRAESRYSLLNNNLIE